MRKEIKENSTFYYDVIDSWVLQRRRDGSICIFQPTPFGDYVAIDDSSIAVWAIGTADDLAEQFLLMREIANLAISAIERIKAAIDAAESERGAELE